MPGADAAAAVLDAAERRAAALARGDAGALRALLHPCFRWTSHRGERFDRAGYIERNTADPSRVWVGQRLEDVSIAVAGDTAVLTAVVVDEVRQGGAQRTFRLHMTQTWTRTGGGWKCLAGHAGPEAA